MSNGFKDLRVWQRAHALASRVDQLADKLPPSELYALTTQMRRAARSVSHNIAEGAGRRTRPEFLQFLYIARGSLAELEDQLLFARERRYRAVDDQLDEDVEAVRRMLNRLITTIANDPQKSAARRRSSP